MREELLGGGSAWSLVRFIEMAVGDSEGLRRTDVSQQSVCGCRQSLNVHGRWVGGRPDLG